VPVGIGLVALLVGLMAGAQPALAVAFVVAIAAMALMLSDLALGLAMFTVVIFVPSLGGSVSIAKIAGLLLVLSWLAITAVRRTSDRQQRSLAADRSVIVFGITLFVVWAALSLIWAQRPDLGADALSTMVLNLALFPIVFAAVREPRHVRWVFAAFVAGALLSAAIGLVFPGPPEPGEQGRLAGAGIDSNPLGGYLMVSLILAATLAASRQLSTTARTAAGGAAVLCLMFQLMTGSRGALLGLVTALLVAPFIVPRGRRAGVAALAVLAVLSGVAFILTVAPAADLRHITQSDSTGSGRTDIWRVGLRIVQAHPIAGVGTGNFSVRTVDYLLRPGVTQRAIYIVDEPKVAHNIYLEVLAELGSVGFVLFAVIIGASLSSGFAAARLCAQRGRRETEALTRGLLIAIVGLLVAAFFSSELYSKQLWLLLALAVALWSLARAPGVDRHRARAA
jgi:O-antigen ligase